MENLTWPHIPSLANNHPDMLRTFLHFAGKIECSCYDEIRIGIANLNFDIEASDVDLSRGECLLPDAETTSQFCQFWHELLSVFRRLSAEGSSAANLRWLKNMLNNLRSESPYCCTSVESPFSSAALISERFSRLNSQC